MMTKIQNTPTNTSNVCPEPEVVAPPQPEPGMFETFVKNVSGMGSDIIDKATGPLTFSPTALKELDEGIDTLRDTKLGKLVPQLAVLDDLTDGLLAAQDYFVEQGKNPLDLLAGMPEAAERVVSRANEMIREVRGDAGLQLTLNPTEMDLAKTAEILSDGPSRGEYLLSIAALTIETLAENSPNIQRIANSNTSEFLDKASTVAGVVGDVMLLSAAAVMGPFGIAAVAVGRPASTSVEKGKEFLKTISNAEDSRAIFDLVGGPSPKLIKNLAPDETLLKEVKVKLGVGAGKGLEYEGEIELKCAYVNGRYLVTYTMDNELAGVFGLAKGSKVDGVSIGGGHELVFACSTESWEEAAYVMQGNPTGIFAKAVERGLTLETVTSEGTARAEVEFGPASLNSKHGLKFDLLDPNLKFGGSLEGKVELGQEYLKFSTHPSIDSVSDLLDELTQPSLHGNVETEAGFYIGLAPPTFECGLKATVEKGDLKLEVKIELEIDFLKAAKHLGLSVMELKAKIESKEFDPESWWKKLPNELIQLKVKVEGTESRGVGIDTGILSGKTAIEKKTVFEYPPTEGQTPASEFLSKLRSEVTKGELLNRPLRG